MIIFISQLIQCTYALLEVELNRSPEIRLEIWQKGCPGLTCVLLNAHRQMSSAHAHRSRVALLTNHDRAFPKHVMADEEGPKITFWQAFCTK